MAMLLAFSPSLPCSQANIFSVSSLRCVLAKRLASVPQSPDAVVKLVVSRLR